MIQYRAADEGDAADISALISSFHSELIQPDRRGGEDFLASVSVEAVRSHLASPEFSFLVAHEQKLIGVIAIRSRSHLYYFFVDQAHQKRGVGRKLWDLARNQAMAGGHPGTFTVFASLGAVPVYDRFGFRATGDPTEIFGVRGVHMVTGEARGIRKMSIVLPREHCYPAMNEAAEDIVRAVGPAFTRTLDPHIPTGIAAAASLAGSVLLRVAAADAQAYPATEGKLSDLQSRQGSLLIFMEVYGPRIDPGIERTITRGAGLKGAGWEGYVHPRHEPLLDTDVMVNQLQDLPDEVTARHGIPPIFRAHIPALAAMKLISAGHKSGLLDRKEGKALAHYYLAAGCGTEPVPLRGE